MFIKNRLRYKSFRKGLRKNQTDAERKVWYLVRNKQVQNLKFFRQYGAGNYILDYYCPRIKLAIEIDGGQHNEDAGRASDKRRTMYLESLGIKMLRFWDNEVMQNIEGVYQAILKGINSP